MPPDGWFHGWGAQVETDLGNVNLLNVHLRPGGSGQGGLSYLNVLRLSTIHPREVRHLWERLRATGGDVPAIVLGDFNESDDGKAIQYLTGRGFTDALSRFDTHSKTWHGRALGITLSNRCDHILFDDAFRCLDAAVMPDAGSDHRPVVAVLEKR